jgi:hypothetical protein
MDDETRARLESARLVRHGFDGLYHPDPGMACGCFVGDLYPCSDRPPECRPGHASPDGRGVYRRADGKPARV